MAERRLVTAKAAADPRAQQAVEGESRGAKQGEEEAAHADSGVQQVADGKGWRKRRTARSKSGQSQREEEVERAEP